MQHEMTETPGKQANSPASGLRLLGVFGRSLGGRATISSVVLVVLGAIIAPSTVSASAFLSLLPFVAILAVVSIGQHLVIQQRGLDISVAGIMSFAAVIVTKLPSAGASNGEILGWIALALVSGLVAGAVNGLVITLLRVPALVTTIGVNAVLFGVALIVSGGVPSGAPPQLASFAINLTLGVPNTIWIALAAGAVAIFITERTTIGRRFVAVSVSAPAAHAVAIPVERYRIGTYVAAGLLYAVGGVMLAGYLSVPNIFAGNFYILATVAAVVVGGNSVAGGARGSILATMIGAFFLTFLSQLVLSAGLDRSMQNVVQALIVIGGVGLPMLFARPRGKGAAAPAASASSAVEQTPVMLGAKAGAVPVLELKGIRKSFGPVDALKNVSFTALPGEIHAVLGENGAGKSTMIAIAAGVLLPSAGTVTLKGRDVSGDGSRGRREAGISVAYQHPALAPDLTVYENLLLAAPALTTEEADALIDSVATPQLRMDRSRRVEELTLAQLHVVEIARALATNPAVLILDEPTEPFQHDDIRKLFALIKALRARGVAIVYVSHRLHEITELADRISILRDGELVASRPASAFSEADIIGLIAGRPLGQIFPAKSGGGGAPMLEVRGLSGAGFANVDLVARAGEIVGLAGVEGEGQREFLRALAGINTHNSGSVSVGGRAVAAHSPAATRAAGIGFVPDDRHAEGLFLNLTVRENIGIGVLDQVARSGLVRRGDEETLAGDMFRALGIRAPSMETTVSDLSGGNQQKVLFAREISARPKVLLIDEPTKGVDIGARSEIYQRLRRFADEGTAVVIAASDGVELEGLCDRVLVFARGSVSRELTGADVTDTAITEANLTTTAARGAGPAALSGPATSMRKFLTGEHFPALVLALLTLAIAFGTNAANNFFLTGFNIGQMLFLLSILAMLSLAQFSTIVVGGIDLSVGPLAGLVVVIASFVIPAGVGGVGLAGAVVGIVAFCAAFGYLQGLLVTVLRLPAIVVTLASFIGLQGVSLILRPRPAGRIDGSLSMVLTKSFLGIPVAMWLALAVVVVFEIILFRRGAGRQLRAVGSNPLASLRLGVDGGRVVRAAFALAGALTGLGGIMLAAQIGIGSGTTGVDFTLMTITAVVLGGVAVTGGRGSALSVLLGAALVQATTSASSFLAADSAWQYTVVGTITLIGACLFSLARGKGRGAAAAH
jgi:ribose transport system ATP-binding protein